MAIYLNTTLNKMDSQKIIKDIVTWLKEYVKNNNIKALVIGVSGGIDSAVTSTLSAMTGIKTYAVGMPICQEKNQETLSDRQMDWLCHKFDNVEKVKINLNDTYKTLTTIFSETDKKLNYNHANANTKSRLRMVTLYHIATANKGIVVGTGNKVEDFGVGFYTKYGDGGVDISPIADLYKSQVYELARNLNIIQDIIDAPPTDGLWEDGRNDEDQIGASYEDLEWVMKEGLHKKEDDLSDEEREKIKIYNKFHYANKHKMLDIPIFKLN